MLYETDASSWCRKLLPTPMIRFETIAGLIWLPLLYKEVVTLQLNNLCYAHVVWD
jgi:hypothetical protein